MLDPSMIFRAPGFAKGTHCVDARPFLHLHPLLRVRTVGFLLVVAFMVTVSAASFSAEQKQPNVLLVLSDDHSVPHVGCYGDGNIRRFGIRLISTGLPRRACVLIGLTLLPAVRLRHGSRFFCGAFAGQPRCDAFCPAPTGRCCLLYRCTASWWILDRSGWTTPTS